MSTDGLDTDIEQHYCLRCGRALQSDESRSRGYGEECWTTILAAAKQVDLTAWRPQQVTDALELIRDGGILLIRDPSSFAFRTAASGGDAFYLTVTAACSCPAGQREILCYHRAAVMILLHSFGGSHQ